MCYPLTTPWFHNQCDFTEGVRTEYLCPSPQFMGFPCGSASKESNSNVGDLGSILGLGKSPGEGQGYPLQYSGLENPMDCIVPGVVKSWTQLSDFHFSQFICWKSNLQLDSIKRWGWGRWLGHEGVAKETSESEVKSLSRVRLFVTSWTVAYQAPLSMGFSRQEYWSGLPCPSPGDLPDPGIEPRVSHIVGRHFTVWATREVQKRPYFHFFAMWAHSKQTAICEAGSGFSPDTESASTSMLEPPRPPEFKLCEINFCCL